MEYQFSDLLTFLPLPYEVFSTILTYQSRSEYSDKALDNAIQVYKTKIHLQPLPLFSMQGLSDYLAESSPFLRYSFLALCLNFIPTSPTSGLNSDTSRNYSRVSHESVMKLVSKGTATLEILQALCLLALNDILGWYQYAIEMEKLADIK